MRVVRIKDIASEPDAINLLSMAIYELALATALDIVHGDRAAKIYADRGGHVRFDNENQPCLILPDIEPFIDSDEFRPTAKGPADA